MGEQGASHRREHDRLGPTRPVEDGTADEGLESGDLLADGGLGVAEDVGRPAESALLGHRAQGLEVAYLVARGSEGHAISINDRHDEKSSLYVM